VSGRTRNAEVKNEENALILGKICSTGTSMLADTFRPGMLGAFQ
jgi:hypothetical protein